MDLALIPAAFIAGVLMFLAPCTLPIVPGYLAFIAGAPAGGAKASRRRIVSNALAFVIGFSIIFIALGASAGLLGSLVGEWRPLITRVAGVIIIIFGLTMLNVLRLPVLSKEMHVKIPKFLTIGRWQSSALIGALFALGWSPCIGPILGTILFLAAGGATALLGAFLLGIFSLGLGIPFLLTALLMQTGQNMFGKWATTTKILSYIGGTILLLVGVLMLTDNMGLLIEWGFKFLEGPYNQLRNYM
ncbi:MAG: cytochrome c biogenesis protein CcdA [Patescibacteria group bacterium]